MPSDPISPQSLPYGLKRREIGYLILLGAALYFTDSQFRGSPWPLPLFGAALAGGVAVLAGRCREEWRALPNRFFFLGLAGAWVVLFSSWGNSTLGYVSSPSLFAWLLDIDTAPAGDAQHGLILPFVVLALFWWKRRELAALPLGLWWPGLLIVSLALLLHVAAFRVQEPIVSLAAFFMGLYGLMGLAWGWRWLKAALFPYFLLLFCIPTSSLLDGFTFQLRLLVSFLVAGVAHLGLSPDLIRDGTQLMDSQRTFAYEVADACSGIHSLMALLALTTIYGFVTFKAPWKRAVMILSALPLAVLGNVARLCFTIGVAEMFGADAGKAVETKFGFITFLVAFGAVLLLARGLDRPEPAPAAPPAARP